MRWSEAGRAWWCRGIAAVVVLALAGCSPADVVDALTGGDPVLVTAAEKEEIGYENPEGVRNSSLQRLVMEHRAEIYATVKPLVEEQLGRQVELGDFTASYPYSAVGLVYRTVDEPVVTGNAYVGIASDGSATGIERISEDTVARMTFEGLYLMAYRERITQMREYLAEAYPQFTARPAGYVESLAEADPMFRFYSYNRYGGEDYQKIQAEQAAIYQEYLADPDRTDPEWLALFEQVLGDREMAIIVDLMLVDPQVELTEELSRQVADDVRTNPVFAGFGSWLITTRSNLIPRDATKPYESHQLFLFDSDRDQSDAVWAVDYWEDGGTIWGKIDEGWWVPTTARATDGSTS
jgi:hypothetical protein